MGERLCQQLTLKKKKKKVYPILETFQYDCLKNHLINLLLCSIGCKKRQEKNHEKQYKSCVSHIAALGFNFL